jgi:NodT family efflux transporter outer membrane factor (OMF) lipoprotein
MLMKKYREIPLTTTSRNYGHHCLKLGVGAMAILLSACVQVGPNFEKPEVPVAEGWLESADERISAADADQREWWKYFEDPALEALIQYAYENNPTLEIAGLRVYEGRANLGIATGLKYPQIQQLVGGVERIELSENAEPIGNLPQPVIDAADTTFRNYRLGFNAVWEIDFWGRFSRIEQAALASLSARTAAYDAVLVSLTGEVASTYVLLRTFEERLAVARSNEKIQRRGLEISSVRFNNQLTSELDPSQARVMLKNTQALIPRLDAAMRQTENALSQLLGMRPGGVRAIIGESTGIPETPATIAVGLPADLLRRRPDIRQAEYLAASQSAAIGIAKADLYPAFRLGGTIGLAADSVSDLSDSDSLYSIAGISFGWNIFNYGRIKNKVRANDARFQQTLANYENAVLNAAREVENGQTAFLRSHEEVKFLEESAVAARRGVDIALTQYRDGLASYTSVLLTQRSLLLQEDLLTGARGRLAGNLVGLYRALGGGWELDENHDFVSEETRETMQQRTDWSDLLDSAKPADNQNDESQTSE